MRPLPALLLLPFAATLLPAQRSLADVQRTFVRESRELASRTPGRDADAAAVDAHRKAWDTLLQRQVGQLATWLHDEAKGDDRWNGQLMLVDMQLARGDRAAAGKALRDLDPAQAPALVLTSGAAMAQHMPGQDALRKTLLDAALAKTDVPLTDRLAMARLLSSVLHEVDRGDQLFADALAGATDDEQRALVRWHRADAKRDREDLPENAAFDELEKLAKDLPDTYWGSVAKDRLRATGLQPGDEAIPFRVTTRDGKTVDLAGLRGRPVVLAFWSAADLDTPQLFATLRELAGKTGNVAVLAIALDRDLGDVDAAIARDAGDLPVVADGKGVQTDVALRWFVEGPTVHVIDAAGRVAALGLHAGTADAREQLAEVVSRAARP